jgi:asparagine synthase (glutamine-hydrolysing)
MCGIAGIIAFKGVVDETVLRRMTDALVHRGPDDSGIFLNSQKTAGLGHRRLSIIDLSSAGHQPMANEDGTLHLVFNGEIYNYHELRGDLLARGHQFRSHTDSETVLHGYEEYGEQILTKLRGMFAFAIWDEKTKQLFCATDRLGKKPLKYYFNDDHLIFASELKAIFADARVPRTLDPAAIHHYLTLQSVPHPMTGFLGIRKLPPAHFMIVRNGTVRIKRYWKLSYLEKDSLPFDDWRERVLHKLEEAVKIRMISDVPLGAFLSGGVDSSLVVAMMARHSSKPVRTFSIGFGEQTHNELPKARIIADLFKTDHTEFMVTPNALDLFEKLVYHYEEPYADSSALPTYYVSHSTRQHVTVALSGDGGDECFAGYPWYAVQKMAAQLDRIPRRLRAAMFHGLAAPLIRIRTSTSARRAGIAAATLAEPAGARYARFFTTSFFEEEEKRKMYTSDFLRVVASHRTPDLIASVYNAANATEPVDRAMATDFDANLPYTLLPKADIASSMNSLETRSPFLDHELVELAARMPASMKMRGYRLKSFLRDVASVLLPKEIVTARKQGFMVPLGAWFRGPLQKFAEDRLLSRHARIHAIVAETVLQKLLKDHSRGSIDHGSRIWCLCTLEQWLTTFSVGV